MFYCFVSLFCFVVLFRCFVSRLSAAYNIIPPPLLLRGLRWCVCGCVIVGVVVVGGVLVLVLVLAVVAD